MTKEATEDEVIIWFVGWNSESHTLSEHANWVNACLVLVGGDEMR